MDPATIKQYLTVQHEQDQDYICSSIILVLIMAKLP